MQRSGRTLNPVPAANLNGPGGRNAEVNVIPTLGGVLSVFTGHATWHGFALVPGEKPTVLVALAAVTLTCLLVSLLARGGWLAAFAAAPLRSSAAALREKSWRAGFVSQRDPDAPGRARPRAPTAGPAAA